PNFLLLTFIIVTSFPHSFPTRRSSDLCNLFFIIIQFFSFLHAFLIQCNASLSQKHACGPQFGSLCAFSQKMLQSFYIFRIGDTRSEEHTSELQSRFDIICRLMLEKKKN